MDFNDSPIASITQRYVDDALRNLPPDGEPTPFMVAGGPDGMRHIGLHSLSDPDFPETAKTVIPAFIVLDEAVEVTLAAFTTDPVICGGKTECAFIAHCGPNGRTLLIAEVTRRKTQPPVLDGWLMGPAWAELGLIDEGMRTGLEMVQRIWKSDADDLRILINDIRSAACTSDTDVLPLTVDALREWGWLS